MKNFAAAVLLLLFVATSFAQNDGDKKATRKEDKLMKKSNKMERADKTNGKKSLRKMHKMEKKEDKLNKKAEKEK